MNIWVILARNMNGREISRKKSKKFRETERNAHSLNRTFDTLTQENVIMSIRYLVRSFVV